MSMTMAIAISSDITHFLTPRPDDPLGVRASSAAEKDGDRLMTVGSGSMPATQTSYEEQG